MNNNFDVKITLILIIFAIMSYTTVFNTLFDVGLFLIGYWIAYLFVGRREQ